MQTRSQTQPTSRFIQMSISTAEQDAVDGLLSLHLCTSKTPTLSADLTDKGNSYHALEKCEGVRRSPRLSYSKVNQFTNTMNNNTMLTRSKTRMMQNSTM
jgi:hypothetical protein